MIRLTLIAAAILFACSAMAEEKLENQKELQKVEVKAAPMAYNARRDDTATKVIVSSEELKRYGDTSIGDALKRVPGVTVGAGGRDIRMRGLGNGYTQILLNGERAPAGFNIEALSPELIERIEVMRSATAEFSTQAIAGTINIVLKKAVKTAQRELKLVYAGTREMRNPGAFLTLSDKDGGFSYSLAMTMVRNQFDRGNRTLDERNAPEGAPQMLHDSRMHDAGHWRGFDMAPRLNWTLDGGDTVSWQSYATHNVFSSTMDRSVATPYGELPDYDDSHIANRNRNNFGRSDVTWMHKFGDSAKLETKLGGHAMRVKGSWLEVNALQGLPALDRMVYSSTDEDGFTSTGKFSAPLITDHALAMGWDLGSTRREDVRDQQEQPLKGHTPDNKWEGYQATIHRAAFFAQDEWNLRPRWSLYLGLRWEGMQTHSEGPGFEPVNNRSSVWSPLAQTLYKMDNDKDQLRAALTRTYKQQGVNALMARRFTSTNNSQLEPDYRGNPGLKPELATGIDASYEHYWAEQALFSVSASVRRIENYTRRMVVQDDDKRWVSTAMNTGTAVARSLEMELKFPLKALMDHAPGVDLRANVGRNWSRVEHVPGPDNRLDQQVPLSAGIGADYKSDDGQLALGGSFNLRLGGTVRMDDTRYSYSTASRGLDAYALWKFDKKVQLRLSAWNLLAQDGNNSTSYITDDATLRSTVYNRGVRGARAQLELNF